MSTNPNTIKSQDDTTEDELGRTMTLLRAIEQLEKTECELPEGYYYVKDGENIIAEYYDGYFYNDGLPMTSLYGGVGEVLKQVPSYELWQSVHEQWKVLLEENTKLKELLEEAKEVIEWYEADCGYKDAPTENVLAKINQVLGEE